MAGGSLRRLFKKENSTEEEIKQLVDEDEGELEISQREMINNIFDFDDTTAGDIMTHRTDIVAVEDTGTLVDVAQAAMDEGCSRIPIFHEDLDNILGIIYVKDLLKFIGEPISKDESLKDYIREPLFVPETIPCGKLFATMTETRIQLAIVVDEYGGTAGLVSMEDLIESVMGNIQDEYDNEEEEISAIDEDNFDFEGTVLLSDIEELLDIEVDDDADYDTLSGLIMDILGRIPEEDEHPVVEYQGVEFTVIQVEEHHIARVHAKILPEEAEEEE